MILQEVRFTLSQKINVSCFPSMSSHSRVTLGNTNAVNDFKETLAKAKGPGKSLAEGSMHHLTEESALQFILPVAWVHALSL